MAVSSVSTGGVLDVNGLVSQLMAVESRPFVAMQNKEKAITSQISAYGTLSGAVGAFQTTVTALADASKYKVANATTSDDKVLTATAGKDTVKGNYSVNVTQLAQAQTISAAGQESTSALIGSGASTVLTFDFGSITGGTLTDGKYTGSTFDLDATRVARTVTIDGSNNSLQGIRDAINKAGIGVTASIISDGSDKPNRLVLTSGKSGETSSMRVSVAGDQDLSNLLSYAPNGTQNMTQSNAGQNAKLTVNGVAITSQTNNVENAVPGVTMSVLKIGTSNVGVTMDTSGIKTALTNFVKAYNELNTTVTGLTAVTPDLKQGAARTGGPLVGDSTTNSLQASLRKLFGTSVPGLDSTVTSLSQLGVAFQKDGTLKLDTGKLQTAIDKNSDDVIKLLATSGSTTDSLVSFVSSTSNSTVGTKGISISKLATQGTLVGSTAANLTITAGVNDQLSMIINGVDTKATLVPGNYTADSLVSHLQSLINGSSGVTDTTAGVKVTQENGVFSIVSNKYGSSSKLEITGNGADDLFGTPTMTTGVDVAGTIDGAVAVGSGQTLTGSAGSGSAGIAVLIKGGQLGDRGTVNISKGISALFATITDNYLGTAGLIQNKNDGLNKSIADITKQRDALNTRLTLTEARLRRQYSSLDVTLSSMNSTSNFLTQQLAALAK
ncbi:flagellar filament capping protein FliD [Janthinobacterium tructae]|uniref:flagellar filament capping protein FliD n=1 Tax=Janthinobacterium tructae TaxID=2590869 RepID=UPI00249C8B4D|nr:flagellar filament capping protein FliD [Janthinobacterium tructae]MDI3293505.1 flagellar filament capping protein FliD [Janthinobacterium tructae]